MEEISPNRGDDDQGEQGGGQVSPTEEGNYDHQEEDLTPGTTGEQEDSGTEVKPSDSDEGDGHDGGSGGEDISPTETTSGSDEAISPNDSGWKDYGDKSQSGKEKINPVERDHGDGHSLEGQSDLLLPDQVSMAFRLP